MCVKTTKDFGRRKSFIDIETISRWLFSRLLVSPGITKFLFPLSFLLWKRQLKNRKKKKKKKKKKKTLAGKRISGVAKRCLARPTVECVIDRGNSGRAASSFVIIRSSTFSGPGKLSAQQRRAFSSANHGAYQENNNNNKGATTCCCCRYSETKERRLPLSAQQQQNGAALLLWAATISSIIRRLSKRTAPLSLQSLLLLLLPMTWSHHHERWAFPFINWVVGGGRRYDNGAPPLYLADD